MVIPATYADLEALPATVIGQLVFGALHSHRRSLRHQYALTALSGELGAPFKRARGGPGGWVMLNAPEVHLREHVLVPDLVGWTRERMPVMPDDKPYFDMAPDWVCEVLSPSTAALDRGDKLKVYGEHRVRHVWFVDPDARTLEVLEFLADAHYHVRDVFSGEAPVRAVPFDAIELDLGALWAR